jgi:PPK2 family polyphosphate:nucleotide phosphotransferase
MTNPLTEDVRARLLEQLVVRPGEPAGIATRDSGWSGGEDFGDLAGDELHKRAKDALERGIAELSDAQELLWASDRYAVLVVLQAMDAAGKDSAIEHVMKGVNPQGVQVVSFKKPSSEELDHDFLWRTAKALPDRGRIGIFNRSHYEEVVALKVHPEWLEAQRLPPGGRDERFWQERYEDINAFERHLDRNGTKIVKVFLHVSKEVQKQRFFARLDTPGKEWKFNAADVAERARWDDHMTRVRGRADGHVHPLGPLVRDPGRPQGGHAGPGRAGARRDGQVARAPLARGLRRRARDEPRGAEEARVRGRRARVTGDAP